MIAGGYGPRDERNRRARARACLQVQVHVAVSDHVDVNLGFAVVRKQPTEGHICELLDLAVARAGAPPRYTVTDQGAQFGQAFRQWRALRGVRPRFGAIGTSPGAASTIELYEANRPASCRPRFEPRARYPASSKCAAPQARVSGKPGCGLKLVVTHVDGQKHLPIVALRKDAHAGKFKLIVLWALDRLGRSMVGNLQVVLELDRIGVQVISAREPWLDTGGPVRSLLIAIFGWVAEQERLRIVERTKAGMDRARRCGKTIGRPRTTIDMTQASALRSTGLSIRQVAKAMGVQQSVDCGTEMTASAMA